MTVDAYALKEKPASWAGLIISILVLLATLVYLAFIIYQFLTASPVQKADIYWAIGSGPFPAPIFCVALDGCYISNAVSVAFATSVALKIDPPQQSCIFLPYKSSIVINITYSTSPLDGLSVIWNASNVDPSVPVGFGAQVDSETNCVTPGSPSCNGGIFMLKTPIGPGFNLLTYVETLNYTATGKYSNGQNRKEWFVVSHHRLTFAFMMRYSNSNFSPFLSSAGQVLKRGHSHPWLHPLPHCLPLLGQQCIFRPIDAPPEHALHRPNDQQGLALPRYLWDGRRSLLSLYSDWRIALDHSHVPHVYA